jgi:putative DNA methylase
MASSTEVVSTAELCKGSTRTNFTCLVITASSSRMNCCIKKAADTRLHYHVDTHDFGQGRMATVAGVEMREFLGFAEATLLESGGPPVEDLARIALREGQSTSPLHRVHRWFARRLSSQFRGMLASLSLRPDEAEGFWERYFGDVPLDEAVVLDPFAGGGTSVVEASRCGARVIGFDLDPVASSIARFELGAAALGDPSDTAQSACARVSREVLPFHKTRLYGDEVDVLHHFWVQLDNCCSCGREFEVHPHYRLAHDKAKDRQWVFCRACYEVWELPLSRRRLDCGCGTRTTINDGTLSRGKVTCPHCRSVTGLSQRRKTAATPPRWRLFAQECLEPESDNRARAYKAITEADDELYQRATTRLHEVEETRRFIPDRAIPAEGRYDQRPLIHGFRRYQQLFNARQLLHLSLLGESIAQLDNPDDKQLLSLAFSEHLATNCMYTGYAFGYRRLSPLFSMHAYRHIVRPVEINPWLIGRGTFVNAVEKIRKGGAFAKAPQDMHPDGGRCEARRPIGPHDGVIGRSGREVINGEVRAAITTRDSTDMSELPDGSVDLILTDPPYFDNICYSELSDFYLVWHQALGIAEPPYDNPVLAAPMAQSLAPPNRDPNSIQGYSEGLRRVFAECHRLLKPQGLCVFTFHHASPLAWLALGEILAGSGLRCSGVLPMRGEGRGGLHSYAGTIKWDAVLVCRKGSQPAMENGEQAMVPNGTVPWATETAVGWSARLSRDESLGFRDPDELNLYRALIVSRARLAVPQEGWNDLESTLKQTTEHHGEVACG